ncbi:fibronectin type III-like domain-contianing protein [Streptomyces sp. NBC_01260]|uniref:fibronectin type III-like domain-contianing protein n=1 Tax=Streptomyces sp. NBC_01383 TaxID=2903846 RepID=UPI002E2F5A4B|nr:fibronectin type III-like domain-contianing protein [Streptomyces sp. NBC_01260]
MQLYVRRVIGATSWPRVRELRGFARIGVVPGERAQVSFPLGAPALASVTRAWERRWSRESSRSGRVRPRTTPARSG